MDTRNVLKLQATELGEHKDIMSTVSARHQVINMLLPGQEYDYDHVLMGLVSLIPNQTCRHGQTDMSKGFCIKKEQGRLAQTTGTADMYIQATLDWTVAAPKLSAKTDHLMVGIQQGACPDSPMFTLQQIFGVELDLEALPPYITIHCEGRCRWAHRKGKGKRQGGKKGGRNVSSHEGAGSVEEWEGEEEGEQQ
eukprot:scaffold269958_cov20-Tisochrysis_lutea.AAC.1